MINKKIVVIAGPSGSGKNTLIREIRARYPRCAMLTSATTRVPRAGETDGVDYYFMSVEKFDAETAAGHIGGQRFTPLFGGVHYGIYIPDIKKKIDSASVIFALVDINGARWLKENYGATTIFIMPESLQQFRARLRARNPEWSDAEYNMRMKITDEEIRIHAPQYDYRIVNGDGALHETVEQVIEILRKEGYTLA
jgi:guanylate kinase